MIQTPPERDAIQAFVDVVIGTIIPPVPGDPADCRCTHCQIYRQYHRLKRAVPWVQ